MLIYVTFWGSLKQSELWIACTYQSRHWKWLFVYWIRRHVFHAGRVQWKCYRRCQKIQRKVTFSVPNHHTFLSVDCHLQEMGTFHWMQLDVGHPCFVCNVSIEEQNLEGIERHLPSVPDVFCTPYITRTTVVSLSHSVYAGDNTTWYTYKMCILSMDFATVGKRPNV